MTLGKNKNDGHHQRDNKTRSCRPLRTSTLPCCLAAGQTGQGASVPCSSSGSCYRSSSSLDAHCHHDKLSEGKTHSDQPHCNDRQNTMLEINTEQGIQLNSTCAMLTLARPLLVPSRAWKTPGRDTEFHLATPLLSDCQDDFHMQLHCHLRNMFSRRTMQVR